ncbi:MFS transporter [Candidatus Woesearchaeota archaeon]|nr:MFS transporter [Candidatus Woesearchaeota archaeon]
MNNVHRSYIATFLRNLSFFGAVAVPYFLDWLTVDYTKIFILEAWFVLWIVLLEIPTGIVADKYGRKVSLALGSLTLGIDYLMFGIFRNYYLMFLAEFIGAIGISLISGADKALLYDSLIELGKKKKAKYYLSRYEASGILGISLSLPLGSIIAGSSLISYPGSLAMTFILSGFFSILAIFFHLAMKEPKRKMPTENFVKMAIRGLKKIYEHKRLRAFTLNSTVLSGITFFMFWFYQSLLRSANVSVTYFGIMGAGTNLFAVFLLANVNGLEKLFGIKNILFYSALVPALLFIALAATNNIFLVLIAAFLIIGLKLLRAPILSDFINRNIESKNRATLLSSVSLLEKAVIAVLYPVVGLLADISLSRALIFLGLLGLIFTFITRIEESNLK